jgi:hypothetical protein
MASGYEKQACGVDSNTGWGEPRPVRSAILTGIAISAAILHYGWLVWSFLKVLAACLGW